MSLPSTETIGYPTKAIWFRPNPVPPRRHNNGMHPTADTHLVMYIETLGAAGDAWR
ncbi:MAG: hypothetical protein M3362_01625 [Acidobacteriota bacterium]|nr:hypothetical protein [Acidobacteriota bacterium]